jgi:predicted AlkP superfamily phosphohydrolase/phosphomutase
MPRMRRFLNGARYGILRSVDPPITVPAWAVMFSGVDPGTLGLYGFRHRRPGTYLDYYGPTAQNLVRPMVWDQLSRVGMRVCVIGMPPGYPPPHVNGVYISDFLTPETAKEYVFPASLQPEIERVTGGYAFDVRFRASDRDRVGHELIEMTRRRFAAARYLWRRESWDFFALHEIGPDRVHHAFWKFFDPNHPRFEDNPALRALAEEYYARLDAEIGALLDLVGPGVQVLLVSDHGSQAMSGCFCINDWLIRKGYLALRGPPPPAGSPLEDAAVDWSRTRAWGAGGYYARIFFNVQGREPEGVLAPDELTSFKERLVEDLRAIRLPNGTSLRADVRDPARIYRTTTGDAPDLMVYFDDLRWRSAGTVGHPDLFLPENDTGPDDSVHSFEGVYAVGSPPEGTEGPAAPQSMIDIGPTILAKFGLPIPADVQGRPIDRFL